MLSIAAGYKKHRHEFEGILDVVERTVYQEIKKYMLEEGYDKAYQLKQTRAVVRF